MIYRGGCNTNILGKGWCMYVWSIRLHLLQRTINYVPGSYSQVIVSGFEKSGNFAHFPKFQL